MVRQVREQFHEAVRDCYMDNGRTTTWITNTSEKCQRHVSTHVYVDVIQGGAENTLLDNESKYATTFAP